MDLKALLAGGDRRSIGQAEEAVKVVGGQPERFGDLVGYLADQDSLVRMRAADAIEKLTVHHPQWLQPHVRALFEAGKIDQKEVRWHVAQLLPRVSLTPTQKKQAVAMLTAWHRDPRTGNIVRVFSLQALADLHAPDVRQLVRAVLQNPTAPPSLRSRAKKLEKMVG